MAKNFAHLHVHSHYSVLDGVILIDKLVERAKELEQPALALTDHGAMYGALEFHLAAKKAGVKPLVGFEAYLASGSRHEKNRQQATYHLTLIAKNFDGYRNLMRLCSESFATGFYIKPRIDKELLGEMSGGTVALSGCLAGEIPQLLLAGRMDEAEKAALGYLDIFGKGNFFLEIMDNGLEEQKKILPPMRELSRKTGIPLVATADVHYLHPENIRAQDAMICVNTGKILSDRERMRAEAGCHMKSAEEMLAALPGFEDAVERTLEVAGLCDLDIPMKGFHLPSIAIPDGLTSAEYMTRLCFEGLKKRYGDPLPAEVIERFEKEKSVVVKMGFPDYFLIVWDLVKFARDNGIPVGPGRGSAAGSIVAYSLGITNLDPLKYGLFFERFLNEGRNEMPDIDLDFDKERRQEVVQHIIDKHGEEHCAKIVTFNCISVKSGIKDVGRVMGMPIDRTNKLSKMVPDMFKPEKGLTPMQTALKLIPELKAEYDADAEVKECLDIAGELDGVLRNTGIHAAGVLVADKAITDYCPLAGRDREDRTTQYEMKMLEKLGLCKIDVLGLETLTLIKDALAAIEKNLGVRLDIDEIPLDDKATFDMLSAGDSKGVFQFESEGFRQLLYRMKPDHFEDLIAAVAIYRPGPLQFLDSFINRKHGREKIVYLHQLMEPILRETYGLILYQEQVQALALDLAHFSLSEGDLMRRAMGKKDAKIMAAYREKFIEQATPTIGKAIATEAYDQIDKFAGYGFNKSHSACYALIAYQTAYLKCHYPKEYMAAILTINRGDADKVVLYSQDAAKTGIKVLPVDINRSCAKFAVEGGDIRFGLSAVKGVGDGAALAVEEERRRGGPFRDLFDFTARIDLKTLNKGSIEALIKAGAFDCLGAHRARLAAGLEQALAAGNAEQKSRASGQMGLFAAAGIEEPPPTLPDVPPWSEQQKLQFEKDVLGFYSSSHPLAAYAARLEAFAGANVATLAAREDRSQVTLGGLISKVAIRNDKNGNLYARIELEDMYGKVEGVAFSRTYEEFKPLLTQDSVVLVDAKVDKSRDTPSLVIDAVIQLDRAEEQAVNAILRVKAEEMDDDTLDFVRGLVAGNPGETTLFFEVTAPEGKVMVRAGERFRFRPGREFVEAAAARFGAGALTLGGRKSYNGNGNGDRKRPPGKRWK